MAKDDITAKRVHVNNSNIYTWTKKNSKGETATIKIVDRELDGVDNHDAISISGNTSIFTADEIQSALKASSIAYRNTGVEEDSEGRKFQKVRVDENGMPIMAENKEYNLGSFLSALDGAIASKRMQKENAKNTTNTSTQTTTTNTSNAGGFITPPIGVHDNQSSESAVFAPTFNSTATTPFVPNIDMSALNGISTFWQGMFSALSMGGMFSGLGSIISSAMYPMMTMAAAKDVFSVLNQATKIDTTPFTGAGTSKATEESKSTTTSTDTKSAADEISSAKATAEETKADDASAAKDELTITQVTKEKFVPEKTVEYNKTTGEKYVKYNDEKGNRIVEKYNARGVMVRKNTYYKDGSNDIKYFSEVQGTDLIKGEKVTVNSKGYLVKTYKNSQGFVTAEFFKNGKYIETHVHNNPASPKAFVVTKNGPAKADDVKPVEKKQEKTQTAKAQLTAADKAKIREFSQNCVL